MLEKGTIKFQSFCTMPFTEKTIWIKSDNISNWEYFYGIRKEKNNKISYSETIINILCLLCWYTDKLSEYTEEQRLWDTGYHCNFTHAGLWGHLLATLCVWSLHVSVALHWIEVSEFQGVPCLMSSASYGSLLAFHEKMMGSRRLVYSDTQEKRTLKYST